MFINGEEYNNIPRKKCKKLIIEIEFYIFTENFVSQWN